MSPLYEIDDVMLDFISRRMRAGQMDYDTAMQTNVVLTFLQNQANSEANVARRTGAAPAAPKSGDSHKQGSKES